ncbi:Uncharacterized protein PHSC3_000729 [Chlamydiales bacterium STE3]|nr:Uncharacterized protein PHSC3_000729 [Chlamydiales bacterium STE3]
MKQIGIFMTIPFVLAGPPALGWLIGNWLDANLHSYPYFMYGLIFLGFIAGFREMFRIVNRFGDEV